jgi:hypothetical protein
MQELRKTMGKTLVTITDLQDLMPETPEQGPPVLLHLTYLKVLSNYDIRRSNVKVKDFLRMPWRCVAG